MLGRKPASWLASREHTSLRASAPHFARAHLSTFQPNNLGWLVGRSVPSSSRVSQRPPKNVCSRAVASASCDATESEGANLKAAAAAADPLSVLRILIFIILVSGVWRGIVKIRPRIRKQRYFFIQKILESKKFLLFL